MEASFHVADAQSSLFYVIKDRRDFMKQHDIQNLKQLSMER